MSTGTGIAVAAIWGCFAASMFCNKVTGIGMTITAIVCLIGTAIVVH